MEQNFDLIIIGSGAAGLAAGIYAGRYRLQTAIISKEFGGETTLAGKIENYPGFLEIDGFDLMQKMREQAEHLGVSFIDAEVTSLTRQEHCFAAALHNKEVVTATSVIFATGTHRRELGLPKEKELRARGVHYCITCDGPLYKNKTIAIAGGGDASVKGAVLASEYAKKVLLIVRAAEVTAEPVNAEQLKKLGGKIELLLETQVTELQGTNRLTGVKLSKPYKGSSDLIIDGLFVEIGADPNAGLAKTLGVALDEHGYIQTDTAMKTNIDGVFAAGDITNLFGRFKQDITAAALGAVAATSAYEDHKIHGDLCRLHALPVKPVAVPA